jgi:hypothetical protein
VNGYAYDFEVTSVERLDDGAREKWGSSGKCASVRVEKVDMLPSLGVM